MSVLESGYYIITSMAQGMRVGRYPIEDLSLLPKRIMTLNKQIGLMGAAASPVCHSLSCNILQSVFTRVNSTVGHPEQRWNVQAQGQRRTHR